MKTFLKAALLLILLSAPARAQINAGGLIESYWNACGKSAAQIQWRWFNNRCSVVAVNLDP